MLMSRVTYVFTPLRCDDNTRKVPSDDHPEEEANVSCFLARAALRKFSCADFKQNFLDIVLEEVRLDCHKHLMTNNNLRPQSQQGLQQAGLLRILSAKEQWLHLH